MLEIIMKKEIYISVDIEADGKIPGPYSMVSLGASVTGYQTSDKEVGTYDVESPENQFYVEIKPISDKWVPGALAVSGFSREYIMENGEDPVIAMTRFAKWINDRVEALGGNSAVFVAFPLGFDWMWTYWYLVMYSEIESPFSHGRHADMKTLYAAKEDELISHSIKRNMRKDLKSKRTHTHNALDDAIEQGETFMNILRS
jgi:hypothetical protein